MTELPPEARRRLLADARELAGADGELLHGRYRLLRELGRGGMGIVYEAEDTALGRRVALKRLSFAAGLGPGLAEAVLREARAAARLDHAHIAAVYDAYPDALVLQLVEGRSLAEVEDATLRERVTWLRDAARAVQHAHEQGLVHRDLKPHNLLVAGGRVFVTDFGLAKELAAPASGSLSGRVLGTPGYMPPEQAAGLAREVDARSDVYGLGATLYHLCAGRPPFVGADVVALLRAVVEDEPPPLARLAPEVPRDLALVVMRCLEKDKARRYPSAAALADDLENWLAGRPVVARAPGLAYRCAKWGRRHRAWVAAGALVVLVAGAALAWNFATRRAYGLTNEALALAAELELLSENAAFAGREEVPASEAAVLEQGLARCRAFLARHPDAGGIRTALGELLAALERDDEARVELERVRAEEPENARARLALGLVLARAEARRRTVEGDTEAVRALGTRARAELEVARTHASELRTLDVRRAEAELLRLEGRLGEAEARYAELARVAPRAASPPALAALALAQGDPDEAFRQAMAAVDFARGLAPAYVAADEARADEAALARAVRQHLRTADGLVAIEGFAARFTDWDARLEQRRSTAAAYGQRALGELRQAARLEREGRSDEALASLEQAAESLTLCLTIAPELADAELDRAALEHERARLCRSLERANEAEGAETRAREACARARSLGADPARLAALEAP